MHNWDTVWRQNAEEEDHGHLAFAWKNGGSGPESIQKSQQEQHMA